MFNLGSIDSYPTSIPKKAIRSILLVPHIFASLWSTYQNVTIDEVSQNVN